jgi:hypothetical protein
VITSSLDLIRAVLWRKRGVAEPPEQVRAVVVSGILPRESGAWLSTSGIGQTISVLVWTNLRGRSRQRAVSRSHRSRYAGFDCLMIPPGRDRRSRETPPYETNLLPRSPIPSGADLELYLCVPAASLLFDAATKRRRGQPDRPPRSISASGQRRRSSAAATASALPQQAD